MLQWIHGPQASAAQMKGDDQWIVFPANERRSLERPPHDQRSERTSLHLGVIFQLKQLRYEARKHGQALSSSRKRSSGRFFFAAFGVLTFVLFATYIMYLAIIHPSTALIQTYQDILVLPLLFWLTLHVLPVIEWLILRPNFAKKSPLLEWRMGSFRINRVAWELGPLAMQAVTTLVILGAILSTSATLAMNGCVTCAGIFLGTWFYLVIAISPFSPGPASHLLSRLLGTEGVLQVQDQFLLGLWSHDLGTGKQAPRAVISATALVAWILIVAMSFGWIADHLAGYEALQMLIVELTCNLLGLGFCIWVILKFIAFLKHHSLLRKAQEAQSFSPTSLELTAWQKSCALLQHVPEMAHLPWEWRWFPAGTLLIRRGEVSREFHWLAFGEAVFIQQDKNSQNKRFLPIHGGSGFGEYEFFHGGARNADVLLRTRSVITTLHYDAIASITTPEMEDRIHSVSMAAQVMDQSQMFHAMPSYAKEEWLCHAQICKAEHDATIIANGSLDTWMGLVIHGGVVIVERNAKLVAELRHGDVFGEMALWSRGPRNANVTAQGDVLYLRWEPDWWAAQVKIHGLEDYINELVAKRNMA